MSEESIQNDTAYYLLSPHSLVPTIQMCIYIREYFNVRGKFSKIG